MGFTTKGTLADGYYTYHFDQDAAFFICGIQSQLKSLENQRNSCDIGNNEQQIQDLTNQYQQNVLKLTGQYLTPNPAQSAAAAAICAAALRR